MSDNVIKFTGWSTLDHDPDRVLEEAKGQVAAGCIVIGETEEGSTYFASSIASVPEVICLMEQMKFWLLSKINEVDQ